MCLLIVKPAGVSIPDRILTNASISNPHGAGVGWTDERGRLKMDKSPDYDGEDIAEILQPLLHLPAIIHFRYTTHGGTNHANAHPFFVGDVLAAHNGVIGGYGDGRRDISDTRDFLDSFIAPRLKSGNDIFHKRTLRRIGAEIGAGNKIAFLDREGQVGIANESAGTWQGGAWYSNDSGFDWKPKTLFRPLSSLTLAQFEEDGVEELKECDSCLHWFPQDELETHDRYLSLCAACATDYLRPFPSSALTN